MEKNTHKLYNRQKLLLAIVQAFGGRLENRDLQKYLFLFTTMCEGEKKSYDFVPYKYGAFSFQSYADRGYLQRIGIIASCQAYWEIITDEQYLQHYEDREKILLFKNTYYDLKGDDLVRHTYKQYPYYAIKSEIAKDLMNDEEREDIRKAIPKQEEVCLFTIGYEGKSFDTYLDQLTEYNIQCLCDVRKNPLSRKYGFSKRTLSSTCKNIKIHYKHLPTLGIDTHHRQDLSTQADYDALFDTYEATTLKENTDAITELLEILKEYKRVALTCFEAKPCMCHRSRVADALGRLPSWRYAIQHV